MNFSEAKDETLLALYASVRRQDADSQSGSRSRVVGKSTKQYADGLREEMARAAAGTSIANVVKITVFLKNVNDRIKVNEVRKEVSVRASLQARSSGSRNSRYLECSSRLKPLLGCQNRILLLLGCQE
jgi:hypothetical protein